MCESESKYHITNRLASLSRNQHTQPARQILAESELNR